MNYWDHEPHRRFIENYSENCWGGFCLGFTKEWMDANLPAKGTDGGLEIELFDQKDGKLYRSTIYAAYAEDAQLQDSDTYETHDMWSLMAYFYGSHHCACNRKQDAHDAGASVDPELECEGDRFLIRKIVCPKFPDLILYSETMGVEELQALLESMKR